MTDGPKQLPIARLRLPGPVRHDQHVGAALSDSGLEIPSARCSVTSMSLCDPTARARIDRSRRGMAPRRTFALVTAIFHPTAQACTMGPRPCRAQRHAGALAAPSLQMRASDVNRSRGVIEVCTQDLDPRVNPVSYSGGPTTSPRRSCDGRAVCRGRCGRGSSPWRLRCAGVWRSLCSTAPRA